MDTTSTITFLEVGNPLDERWDKNLVIYAWEANRRDFNQQKRKPSQKRLKKEILL
jgi:hypothetical protein